MTSSVKFKQECEKVLNTFSSFAINPDNLTHSRLQALYDTCYIHALANRQLDHMNLTKRSIVYPGQPLKQIAESRKIVNCLGLNFAVIKTTAKQKKPNSKLKGIRKHIIAKIAFTPLCAAFKTYKKEKAEKCYAIAKKHEIQSTPLSKEEIDKIIQIASFILIKTDSINQRLIDALSKHQCNKPCCESLSKKVMLPPLNTSPVKKEKTRDTIKKYEKSILVSLTSTENLLFMFLQKAYIASQGGIDISNWKASFFKYEPLDGLIKAKEKVAILQETFKKLNKALSLKKCSGKKPPAKDQMFELIYNCMLPAFQRNITQGQLEEYEDLKHISFFSDTISESQIQELQEQVLYFRLLFVNLDYLISSEIARKVEEYENQYNSENQPRKKPRLSYTFK